MRKSIAIRHLKRRRKMNFKDFIFIPIGWAIDGATPPDAKETIVSTNKIDVRQFAGDADNDVFVPFEVPPDLSGISVKFRVICIVTNATGPVNKGIAFFLKGASIGNGDALGAALGTAVKSSITGRTDSQYDRIVTNWSDDVIITDLLAGETSLLSLYRDISDDDDDYVQKIGVVGIELKYTRQLVHW